MNLTDDGMKQVFAGEATRLAYMTEEATEGNAFLENVLREKNGCHKSV
jgi:naphthoate synthase